MKNFTWKISKADRGTPWGVIAITISITVIIAVYLFLAANYFGATLFTIAPIVIFVIATRGQKDFTCQIGIEGIKANNNEYLFKNLSFFAIIADSLVIKPKKQEIVYLPIYIEDIEEIREILSEQLKEKEYEENFSQIINRFLGIH